MDLFQPMCTTQTKTVEEGRVHDFTFTVQQAQILPASLQKRLDTKQLCITNVNDIIIVCVTL